MAAERAGDASRVNRQSATQREPRLFHLVRHADVSGVSGTGTVAEGVLWSDGAVSLRWRGQWPATSAWEGGLEAVLAVHGHSGATEVRWLDNPAADRSAGSAAPPATTSAQVVDRLALGEPPVGGMGVPTASADGLCARCGQAWPCLSCGP